MTIPVSTITSFRTAFSPFSPLGRPCRILLSLLQNPSTAPASSATHIDIKVSHLPRNSTQLPECTIGFKGGKEIKLEVGKRNMKIGDILDEIARVGRVVAREQSLKGWFVYIVGCILIMFLYINLVKFTFESTLFLIYDWMEMLVLCLELVFSIHGYDKGQRTQHIDSVLYVLRCFWISVTSLAAGSHDAYFNHHAQGV